MGPNCVAGNTCIDSGMCARYCCADSDCGTGGVCDKTDYGPEAGVCVTAIVTDGGTESPACSAPATSPSTGTCFTIPGADGGTPDSGTPDSGTDSGA